MSAVTTAVILAAGLGTRMLPATKAVPKEMLPIVDKPLIQYAVEECVAAGMTDIVFVTAPGKEAIEAHFSEHTRADAYAAESGDAELRDRVSHPARLARYAWAVQQQPRGIAHAVACARERLEGRPFALLFPDDLILGASPCVGQLARACEEAGGGTVIAVQQVAPVELSQYGIVDPAEGGNPCRLRAVVEKPRAADAPSDLGIVGRYILSATIFDHIDRIRPGKNGELQITDAIASQIAAGEPVYGYRYEGKRYDTGRPAGYLAASVAAALDRREFAGDVRRQLRGLLEEAPV